MGRLHKSKVDRLTEMLRQGYTLGEIAKEVRCSESTICRFKKRIEAGPRMIEGANSQILLESVNTLYKILQILENASSLGEKHEEDIMRGLAREMTDRLANIDPDLTERMLEDSGYYNGIRFVLTLDTAELDENDMRFRKEWIDLLRKHYPKKLADVVK